MWKAAVIIDWQKKAFYKLGPLVGAVGITATFFLILPFIQTISKPPSTDLVFRSVDSVHLPEPPPPPEEEPEKENQEKEPPKLRDEAPPLDLSELELVLNSGGDSGWTDGDFRGKLTSLTEAGMEKQTLFSLSDLDQEPRPLYQPSPVLSVHFRRKAPGRVSILFIVNERGRVEKPIVQMSTDVVFERPALAAVKKWKFEPGKRNGKAVRFRMRVPIIFPKGL